MELLLLYIPYCATAYKKHVCPCHKTLCQHYLLLSGRALVTDCKQSALFSGDITGQCLSHNLVTPMAYDNNEQGAEIYNTRMSDKGPL